MLRLLTFLLPIALLSSFSMTAQDEDWRLYKPSTEESEATDSSTSEEEASEEGETSPTRLKERKLSGKKKGEIRYIQDERITVLDEYLKSNPIKHDGYRIQLVFGSKATVASAKSKFVSRWSMSVYEDFLQPNYRLRVGDFLTRFHAEKALRDIKDKFPGAYIVRDKIAVPKEFR